MRILRLWVASICAIAFASHSIAAEEGLGLLLEAGVAADANVTRSRGADKLSDRSLGLRVTKSHVIPNTYNTRLALSGFAGVDAFDRYRGLSNLSAGVQGEFQYRSSGKFAAPTFGVFARATVDAYDSYLRDGYRHSVGMRMLQPLTDRLDLFAAIAYNERDGRSKVFDGHDYSVQFNFDYAVSGKDTIYLGGEYRRGHATSTARPSLDYVDIAEAIVEDDAFPNSGRWAYRLKARTEIATLGYNLGLHDDHSLDFSVRWVRSTALERPTYPGADTVRYYDLQAGVSYLIRF